MDNISNINDNYIGGDFLDGQWCDYYVVIFSGTLPVKTAAPTVVDLSEILPDDNYIYLCQIDCLTATGSSSSNVICPQVYSGTKDIASVGESSGIGSTQVGGMRTRSNSARGGGSWCYIPIYPEDRAMTIWNNAADKNNNNRFCLRRIRRMGTNK